MKKNWILVPVLAVLAFVGSIAVVKADEASTGTKVAKGTDYAALAAKYDKLAADQDAIIAEHETMKVDIAKQNPGKPGISTNEKMAKHCNAIIKDAKKLKADYEAFSAWAKLMIREDLK